MEKQEALEVEDFDQCKYIKQIIDKLKIVGNQLVSLEHQKREAIENEDYEKAKQLKFQIERVKEISYQIGGNQNNDAISMQQIDESFQQQNYDDIGTGLEA